MGLLAVADEFYNEHDAAGGLHVFNCSDPDDWLECIISPGGRDGAAIGLFVDMEATECRQELPVVVTSSEAANWGGIKSLY